MYSDPSQIRNRPAKVYFNELEENLVNSWIAYIGGQKSSFLRDAILKQARLELGLDSAMPGAANEVLEQARVSA